MKTYAPAAVVIVNNVGGPVMPYSRKSRGLTLVLALFFGVAGIHCFYVGRIGRGIVFLLTVGLFGIGWIWDIIQILARHYRDGAGLLIVT